MTDEAQPTPPEEQQPGAEVSAEGRMQTPDEADAPQPEPESDAEPVADGAEAISADDAATMAEELLAQVHAAVADANASGASAPAAATPPPAATAEVAPPAGSSPMNLPSFDASASRPMPAELDLLADVNLNVKIELGRTRLLVDDVLKLGDGAVVELDKLAGDPVDIYVNERHIARGEVLVLNDNFCVRINEIVEPDSRAAG